jgi:hypothetical protein
MSILLTNEQRHHYIDRSPWTPYWSDCFKHQVNWLLEKKSNKSKLIICYGDSWTWGDSLGASKAAAGIDDIEFRSNNIYGNWLANEVDADFVNCAVPGIFNFWIHDRLQILLNHDIQRLSEQYEKIVIIVTLTELGRDFDFDQYQQEFNNFYNWSTAGTVEEILIQAERFDFLKLKDVQSNLPNNCKLIVGRNFTNTFDQNLNIVDNLLSKNWVQVISDPQGFDYYNDVRMMSFGIGAFDKFIVKENLNSTEYKQWMQSVILPSGKKQINLLEKSQYNYKKNSKHPTPYGHKLWADYLLNYITQEQYI